ncbi:MAG TPA: four helix bundle protein [Candidatus Portnoybacteria bacterium]|jgi:four helix bundle protein|nr:four helix bundle protein [Candidatus Portnoybacteria bacterium]MDD5752103.1 four helix bundle protein [Candidatus Portnoybacteria bacterium]HOZ16610.1 four helix bundle protein [Candidatus Portnoybacteria bacterium]HPH52386.1 four helix bundle protein [Candidatus Portnoybacteria bacterium]HPJ80341.1 four helix bundle protein [Candidatus Portnoybacteria bacterium]
MPQDNKKFSEELKKRIYNWILRLIKFLDILNKNDSLCRTVDGQLIRCGTSIGANYVEAIAGSSKKDFVNFLSHALKSANESKFWLALLRDSGKGNQDEINNLLKELIELANILASSIRTMRNK